MKKIILTMVAAMLGMALVQGPCLGADNVRIGVLAKDGVEKCLEQWQGTADYLTNNLSGATVQIVPLGFDRMMPAIENKEVEFFLTNSSMYVSAEEKYGTTPVLTMINSRQGNPLTQFGGVIFTSADNEEINTLADIKGKTFGAVKASSFGGWQMACKTFLDNGIDPQKDFAKLDFLGSHDKVIELVNIGEVEAGTVRTDALERLVSAGDLDMAEIKIINAQTHEGFPFLVSTDLYPEWPLGKVQGVSDELTQKVVDALKKMTPEDPAAKAAKVVGWSDPQDYAVVKNLIAELGSKGYAVEGD